MLTAACYECRNYDNCTPLPEVMESYFKVFKEGNWWTYSNQDQSKSDSIYITDFSKRTVKKNVLCSKYEQIVFQLHSKVLTIEPEVPVTYSNGSKCDESYIIAKASPATLGDVIFLVNYIDNVLSAEIIDSITVRGNTYKNTLKSSSVNEADTITTYFAPEIGLIRWEIQQDTFSITNYHIE
ncbi:MAG: hypothetical protein ACI8ZO_000575 [Flavobacteriales bacterium]|jgi:hypothetical protein